MPEETLQPGADAVEKENIKSWNEIKGTALKDQFAILLLEDQEDDVFLLKRAFKQAGIHVRIEAVPDGVEGIAYLKGEGRYSDRTRFPLPRLILLDLKMPRMGGLEFLEWMEKHGRMHLIPVVVLSSSKLAADVKRVYELRASAFMVKPNTPEQLVDLAKAIQSYWQRAITPQDAD